MCEKYFIIHPLHQERDMYQNTFRVVLIGLFCAFIVCALSGSAKGEVITERLSDSLPAEQEELMQFTAGGHVLGFAAGKVYMVGLGYALIEEFVGAQRVTPVSGSSGESGSLHDTDETIAAAEPFQGVRYPELWNGITLRYDPSAGGLAESVYVIQPGADVQDIRLRYNTDFKIENDDDLRFRHPTEKGFFTLSRPVAWQEIGGQKLPVEVAFKAYGEKTLGFAVGARNPEHALFIDPLYQWHAFYGGTMDDDQGYDIAVTADGIYVAGRSDDSWLGDGDTSPLHSHSGSKGYYDIIVLKLSPDGAYQWHTFYGGKQPDDGSGRTAPDDGYGITATADAVYVAGYSAFSWNGDRNTPPLHPHSGYNDLTVLKLSPDGAYQWHTFYGGEIGRDVGCGVTVTADGIYVAGRSEASWLGAGDTPPLHSYSGDGGDYDISALKLTTDGAYQWHTFYGGESSEAYGYGITATAEGVYVAGMSTGSWNGDGNTPPLHPHSGYKDLTVLKLSLDGAYRWHTFYGSANDEFNYYSEAYDIAVNADGVYVTGNSKSSWNGDGDIPPLHPHSGDNDIAVLKLLSDGAYKWHTFYGGQSRDYGYGITATADAVYVAGDSTSSWNGDGDTLPLNPYSRSADITVLKLATNGAYQWHTFYGSDLVLDLGRGIAVAPGQIYVTGYSYDPEWIPFQDNEISILKLSDAASVHYSGNGATGGSPPADPDSPYAAGATVAVLGNTDGLVRSGYEFNGWNTAPDGTGTSYAPGDTFSMPASGVMLYAQWAITDSSSSNGCFIRSIR
jgi:hypothetical protein